MQLSCNLCRIVRITAFAKGLQGGHYWHLRLLRGQKEKVLTENVNILRPLYKIQTKI